MYTGKVKIGSNKQEFDLIIDTGSSTLWVEETGCSLCADFDHKFNPSKSTTFKPSTNQQTITYGDGSYVLGTVSQDLIFIGDDVVLNTTSNFLLVTTATMSTDNDNVYDGILGLGFSSLNFNNPTLIDSLYASKAITSRLFALYLNRLGKIGDDEGYGSFPSTLEIGTFDYLKYTGNSSPEVFTFPITSTGYWSTDKVTGLNLGAVSITAPLPVIFDSGTSLIVIDTTSFLKLYSALNEDYTCALSDDGSLLACYCKSTSDMPNMVLTSTLYEFTIPSNNVWYREKDVCLLLVSSGSEDFWILGDVFLRDFYVVYNMDAMTVTIANTDIQQTSSSWATKLMISSLLVLFS